MHPDQLWAMDAMYSAMLLAARARLQESASPAAAGAAEAAPIWRDEPDGTRSIKVSSLDQLRAFIPRAPVKP